jgi:3-hexulose-6-phosphate synthase/6-phospho-3-hexuloisomerase
MRRREKGEEAMKKLIKEHADVNQKMVEKFKSLVNTYSLSCVVADSMERDNVMNSAIKMRTVWDKKFIGPAFTVKLNTGDLQDCLEIFKYVRPGDVVVVDAFGETETSIWGGLMSGLCLAAGVVGAVVDGGVRDTDEARMLGFPLASRAVVPRSTHTPYSQRMDALQLNVPVSCGGIIVNPGDIIIADEIGVVCVPADIMEETYLKAAQLARNEELVRADILNGFTAEQLLGKYGRI